MMSATSGLRACIHRGASEIGGSCVELAYDGQRLVLDLGLPLEADFPDEISLPPISGLVRKDRNLLGVLISHGHPDHWGLAARIDRDVPIYMGEVTSRILREAQFFTPTGADFAPFGFLRHQRPLVIGPFTVTPHLVDHSAYDAYAIEVEAGGRRLLYSGDLRGHGRRPGLLTDMVQSVGRPVDVLLLEGTHVRDASAASQPTALTEQDVEELCIGLFTKTEGMVLAAYSPQNVDRMTTLYRAARASGRQLVLDLYAASIAAVVDDPDVPRWDSDDVLIYVPQVQRIKVKRSAEFNRVDELRVRRIYGEELATRARELVVTFRASMIRELQQAACLQAAAVAWSMWAGYLERPDSARLLTWLETNRIGLEVVHASGHASVTDLQWLASALDPSVVVPIHTASPELFADLFDQVSTHPDGEWWMA